MRTNQQTHFHLEVMLENVDNWSTNISAAQIVKIVNKPRLKIDFFLSAPRS